MGNQALFELCDINLIVMFDENDGDLEQPFDPDRQVIKNFKAIYRMI